MAQVSQKNKDYWKKRFEELENSQYHQSEAYYKDLQKQFLEASISMQADIERWYRRLADNNGISYAEAKTFLKGSELEEFRWTVAEYIKAGKENAIDQRWLKELENASARHHISYLEAMKLQAQQHAELLFTEFEGGMTGFLSKSYGEQFYHTAFEVAKTTGIGTNLAKIDRRRIDAIIKKPWAQDGEGFLSRIWKNKEKLVNNLHTELSQSIIRGSDPRQAVNNLAKTMKVSRVQAGRLVMTESAAISSAAQKDCFKELGVEQYEILATLDSRTSNICQEMDGKVFDMKDYEVGVTAPPFHPNCRSTTIPYFDDEFTAGEERAARGEDGKTYYVPAGMKYGEWEKQFTVSELNNAEKMASYKPTIWDSTKPRILSDDEKKDIIAYATQHNINVAELKQFDGEPRLAKEQIRSLSETMNASPKSFPKKVSISFSNSMDDEDYAITNGKTITFNTKALRNKSVTEKNMSDSGIFASNRIEDIAVHESGHLIASVKGEKGIELARKAYYNIYKKEITIDDTLLYLKDNISEYSISYHGSPEDQEFRFNIKRFKEVIPEVLAKDKVTGTEFTAEFLRLLKEGF